MAAAACHNASRCLVPGLAPREPAKEKASMRTEQRHRVVVVGGGYAGTLCAIRLAGRARHRAHVSLVDADGALIQRLRLHELAAGRDVRAFALPGLAGPGVETIHGRATAIDLRAGRVRVAAGGGDVHLPYDTLVLATGSTVDVDTVPGAPRHAHRPAAAAAALRLRAALAATPAGAGVAVVGGGMTGLETASELAEARPALRLRLVPAGRAGGWLSPAGRRHADAVLRRLGVEVVEDARVRAVEQDRLGFDDGAEAGFDLAVWCGGFVATPLARAAGLATDARGCAVVDATLRSVSHPEVLAVGDAAAVPRRRNGAAIRMACAVAVPPGAPAADLGAPAPGGRD